MATNERKSSTSSSSSSNDYSKYGIKDESKQTTSTLIGKTKTCARLGRREWLFLVVSFINIATALGLTLYRLVIVLQDNPDSPEFTFIILLLINSAFCIFYVVHGVLRERVYELYALIAAIIVVALYCILEYFAFNSSGQNTIKLVRVIVVMIMAPPNIALAYLVTRGFGYLEFRIVGASEVLQRMYREAAIFSCLLKFNLQAACSIVVLALKDGTDITIYESLTLIICIPYSLLWCVFGWLTLRTEMKPCAIVFAFFGLEKPGYALYKIIKEYINIEDDKRASDDTIAYPLIGAVSISLLVWFMLMVELVFVYRNFGKGLRERVRSFRSQPAQPVVNEKTSLLSSTADNYASNSVKEGLPQV